MFKRGDVVKHTESVSHYVVFNPENYTDDGWHKIGHVVYDPVPLKIGDVVQTSNATSHNKVAYVVIATHAVYIWIRLVTDPASHGSIQYAKDYKLVDAPV